MMSMDNNIYNHVVERTSKLSLNTPDIPFKNLVFKRVQLLLSINNQFHRCLP